METISLYEQVYEGKIIKLPCVNFVCKQPVHIPSNEYKYHLYEGLMHDYDESKPFRYIAHRGDWLCQDHNGWWHILSDEEYRKEVDNE